MRKYVSYYTTIFLLSVLVCLLYWGVHASISSQFSNFTSPLPDFLTIAKNKQVNLLDLWLPIIGKSEGSGSTAPSPTAEAVLMFDMNTGETLFERNAKKRMPMASITKIMTAIIALENKKNDNEYRVRSEDLVGENTMGLSAGEVLTLEDLLYGLMLPSGNDAAEVLAHNFTGGRDAFIEAMNNKARSLGLTDTQFTNPSGLQGDGEQYTTAYDLLVITRYAIDNYPEFTKITSTYEHIIPATNSHKEYVLYNETNLISTYPGVKGVKTGYTPEAGMCLVTYLDYEGQEVIGVILNSQNRREEMKELLDYSLHKVGMAPPAHQ